MNTSEMLHDQMDASRGAAKAKQEASYKEFDLRVGSVISKEGRSFVCTKVTPKGYFIKEIPFTESEWMNTSYRTPKTAASRDKKIAARRLARKQRKLNNKNS